MFSHALVFSLQGCWQLEWFCDTELNITCVVTWDFSTIWTSWLDVITHICFIVLKDFLFWKKEQRLEFLRYLHVRDVSAKWKSHFLKHETCVVCCAHSPDDTPYIVFSGAFAFTHLGLVFWGEHGQCEVFFSCCLIIFLLSMFFCHWGVLGSWSRHLSMGRSWSLSPCHSWPTSL